MTILDELYIVFKSDASQTKDDIAKLDKQIADLSAKGQKRSDAEVKQLKELRKLRQDQTQDLRDQTKTVDGLGESFLKLTDSIAGLAGAAFTFGALKTGFFDAAKFNSQLKIQADLTGQNAKELKTYGYALEQAGSSAEDFQSIFGTAFGAASQAGLPLPAVGELFARYRDQLRGLSKNEAFRRAQQLGIPGNAVPFFTQSDEGYNKAIEAAQKHAEQTEKATVASREFERALSDQNQSFLNLYDIVFDDVGPSLTWLVKEFTSLTDSIKDSKTEIYAFLGGLTLVGGIAAKVGIGVLARVVLGSAAGAGIAAAGVGTASIGAAVGGGVLLYEGWKSIGHWINRNLGIGDKNGILPGHEGYLVSDSSSEKIVASDQPKSDQNGAPVFENTPEGNRQRINYFYSDFGPATKDFNAGMHYMSDASSSPFNSVGDSGAGSKSYNIKIDQINVQTQATDANGISAAIGQELNSHIRTTVSNFDDGIDR